MTVLADALPELRRHRNRLAGVSMRRLFADDPPDVPLHGRVAWELIERIHPTISVGANELQRDTIARSLGIGVTPAEGRK